ncbi:hypothetical protein OG345_40675 (plasmid) [Streptomyces sp. NBC_01220]|uniref:Uncharacterized protein n=1 Tax=Streptomyces poriferorum TaxID=2798799 RepID=A0ABY9J1G0_9ACTN|nr:MULTISPECIES: hypothetical protein [unclassified Streptomyces]MDP5309373.1 hypothetical protein [Streptomyces sp. Alt4]WLQ61425.1 hypothetical protein P8A19_41165 [Streptomyces sp. Alt2]WSQ49327.1 hypothetical protein OG345_40675 [Streptomyces sp. NBC_01220]
MGQITETSRARNEQSIRAAMDRLLNGEVPAGGRCDLKTLAAEAGVTRTGFYAKKDRDGSIRPGPYQHLADEFNRRLQALHEAGDIPDPRDAQIDRLKAANKALQDRLAEHATTIEDLTDFNKRALSQLAAQHEEINQLRRQSGPPSLRALPPRRPETVIGTCS